MGLLAQWLCLRALNGMDIGSGPSGNDGYALGLLMEWTSQLTIATIQVGNARTVMPVGTIVMPLGTMVMPSGL